MNFNNKATNERSLVRSINPYIRQLVGLISFLIIVIVILSFLWFREYENEKENFDRIGLYHMVSVQHLDKMENEVLIIQRRLSDHQKVPRAPAAVDNIKKQTLISGLENFKYSIADYMTSLKVLQSEYNEKIFIPILTRLDTTVIIVVERLDRYIQSDTQTQEDFGPMFEDLRIKIKQLDLLHQSVRDDQIKDVQQTRAAEILRYFFILAFIIFVGFVIAAYTIRGINSLSDAQKKAESEKDIALKELQNANRAKSDFLAHMSHDLRTPLNSILGFSQMMSAKTFGPIGDPRYEEYLQLIYHSGERLLSLVNDILDLSRLESGEYSLQKSSLNMMGEAINCFQRCTATPIKDLSSRFNIQIDEDAPLLYSDGRAIAQILDNLVSNAIKYAGPEAEISIKWFERADGHGVLEVGDTGEGMPDKYIENILEPFVQASTQDISRSSVSRNNNGVGLGLHIVTKLAAIIGSEFIFDCQEGSGTIISLIFPKTALVYEEASPFR